MTGQPIPETPSSFFTYDRVYDEKTSTQTIFNEAVRSIVKSSVEGLNGVVFAYGQTSSGKTFTMTGESSQQIQGLVQLANDEIFRLIGEAADRDFLIRVSYLEIYREELRDLLDSDGKRAKIKEDPTKGVYVEATEKVIGSYSDLMSAVQQGRSTCVMAPTEMNERSSRSHTIFRVIIESKDRKSQHISSPKYSEVEDGENVLNTGKEIHEDEDLDDPENEEEESTLGCSVLVGTLTFVDLAGSESIRLTGASGDRAREGGKINQSLLALSQVINSLGQSSNGGSRGHINFRDSKLTRVLQPVLSGNSRMVMVCCISGYSGYLEETRSTLQFACRAKLVKTKAVVNQVMDERAELRSLRKELKEVKALAKANMQADLTTITRLEEEKTKLEEAYLKQKQKIVFLQNFAIQGGPSPEKKLPSPDMSEKTACDRKKKERRTWCPGDADFLLPELDSSRDTMTSSQQEHDLYSERRRSAGQAESASSAQASHLAVDYGNQLENHAPSTETKSLVLLQEICALLGLNGVKQDLHSIIKQATSKITSLLEENRFLKEDTEFLREQNITLTTTICLLKEDGMQLSAQKEKLAQRVKELEHDSASLIEAKEEISLLLQEHARSREDAETFHQIELDNEKSRLVQVAEMNSMRVEELQNEVESLRKMCASKDVELKFRDKQLQLMGEDKENTVLASSSKLHKVRPLQMQDLNLPGPNELLLDKKSTLGNENVHPVSQNEKFSPKSQKNLASESIPIFADQSSQKELCDKDQQTEKVEESVYVCPSQIASQLESSTTSQMSLSVSPVKTVSPAKTSLVNSFLLECKESSTQTDDKMESKDFAKWMKDEAVRAAVTSIFVLYVLNKCGLLLFWPSKI